MITQAHPEAHCKDPPECINGGFINHDCVCYCPRGYTGKTCETVITDNDCGGMVDVPPGKDVFVISPGYPASYPLGKICRWGVKAPDGWFIRMTVEDLHLPANFFNRCYSWLEIQYNLPGQTGIIRCGDMNGNQWTGSKDSPNFMTLTFNSMYVGYNLRKRGFRLRFNAIERNVSCRLNPCLNGGACKENGKSFTCTCPSAYAGTRCENEVTPPNECLTTAGGANYFGHVNTTVSGRTCMRWDSQSPHGHSFGIVKDQGNYCRNPYKDEAKGPWCYTTDPNKRWEFCNIPCMGFLSRHSEAGVLFAFRYSVVGKGQTGGQLETQFENPLGNFPLLNFEFDHQTRNVFVSARNVLYRFSIDGTKLIQKMARITGPEVNCLQLPSEELKKYCGDDYNTVMVVTPDSLITCGTLRGGLCMRRHKEFLNLTSTNSFLRLVSSDQASAVGIFLNISDRSSSEKFENILLFAKQSTYLPLSSRMLGSTAILSVLPDLSPKHIGFSKFGKHFDMILVAPWSVVMDYRVVIENENFVFILVNQNSQSKLVKICKSIDSEDPKKAYEDIPISCNSGKTNLTHVKHGMFITISGKRYLISLFSSSKPTLSAMCVFEENEIYQAFLKSRKHRYMCPKKDIRLEEMIFKDDRLPICISVNLSVSKFYDTFHKGDYCNDVPNHIPHFGIIVGLLPLQGNAVYSTKSHLVTVVGSSTINDLINIYIGTETGYIIQGTEEILATEFRRHTSPGYNEFYFKKLSRAT
uniref:Plasminogen n=1 Tax=Magallana gigas TaxID=29159 RepID=K1Q971_MAGGI